MTDMPPSDFYAPPAAIQQRHFSLVWVVPIIIALMAGYLAVRSYTSHGPAITISFRTAEGLSSGQTSVKYKSVVIGTVDSITLKDDRSGVIVHVRMAADTTKLLTDHAHFWIQKPQLTSTNLSDIVSGTYIALDPGPAEGAFQTDFLGLENPPPLPAEVAGTMYLLQADHVGAISPKTPIYFRDINVGEVLGVMMDDMSGPITVKAFIHAPYDRFVKPGSRFWKASSISAKLGSGGLHVELQSFQSLLEGGIAFSSPANSNNAAPAPAKTAFKLYPNQKLAEGAMYAKRIPYVTYVQSAVKDLAPGSPVQLYGVPVGDVTDIKLSFDQTVNQVKVRVAFEIEPELAFGPDTPDRPVDGVQIVQRLTQQGMRVKMASTDLIAGQEILSLEFIPHAEPAELAMEGDATVLPGVADTSLTGALSEVTNKLNQIPFEQIGEHLNHLMAEADKTIAGPEMHQAVHDLSVTLANAQNLSAKANTNLTPALQKLPDISTQLQNAAAQANSLLSSMNAGYGQNSDFQRNSKRVLDEVNDAARSIRLLADFLERHPEALIEGKTPEKSKP